MTRPVFHLAAAAGLLLFFVGVAQGQAGDEGEGDDDKNGTVTPPDGLPTSDLAVAAKMTQMLAAYNPMLSPGQAAVPKFETRVYLGIGIYALINVDLSGGVVKFSSWCVFSYADPRLKYSNSEVNGIDAISLKENRYKEKKLWDPGLYMYGSVAKKDVTDPLIKIYSNEARVKHHNRNIQMMMKQVNTVTMNVNVAYYPFDKQTITMQYGIEGDDSVAKLALSKRFGGHSIWCQDNVAAGLLRCKGNHSVCWKDTLNTAVWSTGSYTTVTHSMTMTRIWTPYFLTWILPMQVIWFISYSTYFQDPIGEGGRDEISITAFLAMVFYQIEIKGALPAVPYIPWIEFYLFAYTLMTGFATLVYVYVVMWFRDNNEYDWLSDMDSIEEGLSLLDNGDKSARGLERNESMAGDAAEKIFAVKIDIACRYGVLIMTIGLNVGSVVYIWYFWK